MLKKAISLQFSLIIIITIIFSFNAQVTNSISQFDSLSNSDYTISDIDAWYVCAYDNYLYVASDSEVMIFNLEPNPQNPQYVGYLSGTYHDLRSLHVDNDILFAELDWESLYLINISDPTSPITINSIPSMLYSNSRYFLDNTTLYVANGIEGLDIHDISDPYNYQNLSHIELGDSIKDVYVSNDLAYILSDYISDVREIAVYDVSTPSNPELITSFDDNETLTGELYSIFAKNNVVYVIGLQGLFVFSYEDSKLKYLTKLTLNGNDYTCIENTLYISGYQTIFYEINITNPKLPVIQQQYSCSGGWGHTINNETVYMASGLEGVTIVNNSDIYSPPTSSNQTGFISINYSIVFFTIGLLIILKRFTTNKKKNTIKR